MTTNSQSMDLDTLIVRDLYFKDVSNKPVPPNKLLTTRADGGVYFTDPAGASVTAYQTIRAGPDITMSANDTLNTLYMEPGAGISYHKIVEGGVPKLYIAANAPEQIITGDGRTLKFSDLTDTVDGGRTLYFAGKGDTNVHISDTTILFESAAVSTLSTISTLANNSFQLYELQSTMSSTLSYLLSTANTLLLSTSVSTFYSTLMWTHDSVVDLSGYVHARLFDETVRISTVDAYALNTSSLRIGSNAAHDSNILAQTGYDASRLNTAFVINGVVSTHTNYLVMTDNYTHVRHAYEKEYLYSQSTIVGTTSSLYTFGQTVASGILPQYSTQSYSIPTNPRDNFVPVIEQYEAIEYVHDPVASNTSSVTRYALRNVGHFHEIHSGDGSLYIDGHVNISTLTVSTINAFIPGVGGSTFAFAYIDSILPISTSSVTISTLSVSTINDAPYGNFSTANISSATVGHLDVTNTMRATHMEADTGSISSAQLSSIYANNLEVLTTIDTSVLRATQGDIQYLNLNTTDTVQQNALHMSSGTLYAGIARSADIRTDYISSGVAEHETTRTDALYATVGTLGDVAVRSLSTSNLSTAQLSAHAMYASSIQTRALRAADSIHVPYMSTTEFLFGSGVGDTLYVSSISTQTLASDAIHVSTLYASNTISGAQMFAREATFTMASSDDVVAQRMSFTQAAGQTISTAHLSTGRLSFGQGDGTTLTVETASVAAELYARIGVLHDKLHTPHISTGYVHSDTIHTSTLGVSSIMTTRLDVPVIQTASISTSHLSTAALAFTVGVGAKLDVEALSTGAIHLREIYASEVVASARISSATVETAHIYSAVLHGSTATLSTLAVANDARISSVYTHALSCAVAHVSSIVFAQAIGPEFQTNVLTVERIIYDDVLRGPSTLTSYISTGLLTFAGAQGDLIRAEHAQLSTARLLQFHASSINGLDPHISSYSTLAWQAASGLSATVSTLRVSTIMGIDLPVMTFDMTRRRIGINLGPTTQPRATVDVGGVVYASNFITSSDRRLKTAIEPLVVSPHMLPNAYRFRWRVDDDGAKGDDIGVLADEVDAVAPECVYVRPDGYKGVDYPKLVTVLLSAMHDMRRRLERLEK